VVVGAGDGVWWPEGGRRWLGVAATTKNSSKLGLNRAVQPWGGGREEERKPCVSLLS